MKELKYGDVIIIFVIVFCGFIMGAIFGYAEKKHDAPQEITTEVQTTAGVETTEEATVENTEIELTTVKYEDIPQYIDLGTFELNAYCGENYPHICNDGESEETATGTKPKANHTVSVDTSIIPYGTELLINGQVYVAEDCGDGIKGKKIDIFFDTHQEALEFGVKYAKVFEVVR